MSLGAIYKQQILQIKGSTFIIKRLTFKKELPALKLTP